jgi:hypothetical protein
MRSSTAFATAIAALLTFPTQSTTASQGPITGP